MAQSKAKGKLATKSPPKASVEPEVKAPVPLRHGQTWEYTILALGNSLERQTEQLTRMGELCWEMVSLIAPGPPHGGLSLAYLKRPLQG